MTVEQARPRRVLSKGRLNKALIDKGILPLLKGRAAHVLEILVNHMRNKIECDPSVVGMASRLRVDRKTVTRAIQCLEEQGVIVVFRRCNHTSVYRIHPSLLDRATVELSTGGTKLTPEDPVARHDRSIQARNKQAASRCSSPSPRTGGDPPTKEDSPITEAKDFLRKRKFKGIDAVIKRCGIEAVSSAIAAYCQQVSRHGERENPAGFLNHAIWKAWNKNRYRGEEVAEARKAALDRATKETTQTIDQYKRESEQARARGFTPPPSPFRRKQA